MNFCALKIKMKLASLAMLNETFYLIFTHCEDWRCTFELDIFLRKFRPFHDSRYEYERRVNSYKPNIAAYKALSAFMLITTFRMKGHSNPDSIGFVQTLSPYTQCLKVIEKVAFNIASEASSIYILSESKMGEKCQNWKTQMQLFWWFSNTVPAMIFRKFPCFSVTIFMASLAQ